MGGIDGLGMVEGKAWYILFTNYVNILDYYLMSLVISSIELRCLEVSLSDVNKRLKVDKYLVYLNTV